MIPTSLKIRTKYNPQAGLPLLRITHNTVSEENEVALMTEFLEKLRTGSHVLDIQSEDLPDQTTVHTLTIQPAPAP